MTAAFKPPDGWRSDVKVEALCNTPDDVLLAHVRENSRRDLPWLPAAQPHDGVALLVGGGPSLTSDLEEIRTRSHAGARVIAINDAANFLKARGIAPDWQLVMDARVDNLRFVADRPAKAYLLCSQCHASLFDHLADERVLMFHMAHEGVAAALPPAPAAGETATFVGGGITSGLTAMAVAHTAGYRKLHLYGFDSSDADDGEAHAYAQPQNERERLRIETWLAGRRFRSSFAMFKQAEEFERFAGMLADDGAVIHVHGHGLLPTIAHEMARPRDLGHAVYDLGSAPASYDFLAWLVAAEINKRRAGIKTPLRVSFNPGPRDGFRNDALPVDAAGRQRFLDHVLRPSLALIGAVEEPAIDAMAYWPSVYTFRPVVELCRDGNEVPRFEATPDALRSVDEWLAAHTIKNPIVITLREATHWPQRNSRLLNWLRFAGYLEGENIPVVFVRDTEKADEPLFGHLTYPDASRDLLVRYALMSRAKCNLIGANGPVALALFSAQSWLSFQYIDPAGEWSPGSDIWWRQHHGIGVGEQFPWSRPDQRIVWESDFYPAIRDAWDRLEPLLNL